MGLCGGHRATSTGPHTPAAVGVISLRGAAVGAVQCCAPAGCAGAVLGLAARRGGVPGALEPAAEGACCKHTQGSKGGQGGRVKGWSGSSTYHAGCQLCPTLATSIHQGHHSLDPGSCTIQPKKLLWQLSGPPRLLAGLVPHPAVSNQHTRTVSHHAAATSSAESLLAAPPAGQHGHGEHSHALQSPAGREPGEQRQGEACASQRTRPRLLSLFLLQPRLTSIRLPAVHG